MNRFSTKEIRDHEKELLQYCTEQLTSNFGNDITIYGPTDLNNRSSIISFTFKNYHPHDIATILDEKENINSNSTYGIEYRPYRIEAGRQKFEIRHLNYNRKRKIGIMKCGSFSVYIYKNGKEILDFHKRKDVRVIMSKNVNYKIIIENHSKEAIDFELIID